jgi:Dna[CI] antecedent, DciA
MGSGVSKRFPSHYDGPLPTTRHIRQLLSRLLEEIGRKCEERPDLVLAAWPEVIGQQLAPMTQAIAFADGVLTVKVKNSTLYSLLTQNDKPRLIKNLRDKFPRTLIKTIFFRLG